MTLPQFKQLARRLAVQYQSQPATIGLIGPLGAGKTTFVKNFGSALGVKPIKSPSFTIVNNFPLKHRQFYHIDFYRLRHLSELRPLGIIELLKQHQDLIIIEWLDKFPQLKKHCELIINIAFGSNKHERNVTVETTQPGRSNIFLAGDS